MNTERALLEAIKASPVDDLPRLAFADFLEETGRPERAEFIRIQCEVAKAKSFSPPDFLHEIATSGRLYSHMAATQIEEMRADHDSRVSGLRMRQRALLVDFPAAPWWPLHGLLTDSHPHRDVLPPPSVGLRCHGLGVREVSIKFHRGFVVELSGELVDLMGRCNRCDGDGRRHGSERTFSPQPCIVCGGSGVGEGPSLIAQLCDREPLTRVVATDMPIYPSGGNDTYYVGGLGRLPQRYWSSLEGLPSRVAAQNALSDALMDWSISLVNEGVTR